MWHLLSVYVKIMLLIRTEQIVFRSIKLSNGRVPSLIGLSHREFLLNHTQPNSWAARVAIIAFLTSRS
jgi:hypothetical protein